uniref:Uncharacterized protein n=1 Tax=Tanacetum cinerariifolium TaxID=118510 RepID=A0A699IHS1_TANCI|nr:hypothetical protein [Tanacetum cinerariifolium]
MGGSSLQPHTEQPMSPIHAFPTEDMYSHEFSDSFQHTGRWILDWVLKYFKSKTKALGRRAYDMINGKWKTARLNVARFCGVYVKVICKVQESGTEDKEYFNRALLNYEPKHEMQFTLRHYGRSSSFNRKSKDASNNLNVDIGDDVENKVHEFHRPTGRDKAKGFNKKGLKSSGSSSSTNDEALASLMVFELAMHNERATGMKKEERRTLSLFGDQNEGGGMYARILTT